MVRSGLLDQRLLAQAIYRNWTGQLTAPEPTRVLIVQIDTETLRKQRILGDANPIDRALLSDLIATLVEQKAQVIGIDYLLDSHDPVGNPILNQTLQQAVDQRSAWFIFAGIWDNQGQWQTVLPGNCLSQLELGRQCQRAPLAPSAATPLQLTSSPVQLSNRSGPHADTSSVG